ncbi:MAG: Uma2 family endonuclease [Planctomycetaceae bacterium]
MSQRTKSNTSHDELLSQYDFRGGVRGKHSREDERGHRVTIRKTDGRISIHLYSDSVQVPIGVHDLASFRQWMRSDKSPEKAPVFFLAGEVWLDMSKEQLFSHNQLKMVIAAVLWGLAKPVRGRFLPDGMLLTNEEADLSGNPDGVFVFNSSIRSGRVRLIEGKEEGYVELEGSPDMVLEVVSDSSVDKDNDLLMDLYWKAGIREYWLVDARGERLEFQIYRHTARGYVTTRPASGWRKSPVFGKAFRLTRQLDELGHPDFTLDVK